MTGTVRFVMGGRTVESGNFDPQLTVLEYLRSQAGRCGTKEGCAEGDCGACTVVVAELDGDGLRYSAVNACIQLLASLDGKQLITVEDLANDGLHPVQRAMVDQHGSQCGFCTPGFVMSLFALYHQEKILSSRAAIDEGLAGNLCRCTGYAPIVQAARQVLSAPAEDAFSRDEHGMKEMLRGIRRDDTLALEYEGRLYFSPRSLDALCGLLEQYPAAVMVAGATDLGLWITKQMQQFDTLVDVSNVDELRRIEINENADCLEIGAAVTYTRAMDKLCGLYPDFRPLLTRLGATQVRNAGTIGGNIANGSPIGDMPPALIALGSKLVLRSSSGGRTIDLERFFIDYGKQDLQPGECVEKILLPLPQPGLQFRSYKLSKRFDQDISSVCGAYALKLEEGTVASVRICYGAMAGTPKRAANCEQALLGRRWNQSSINDAKEAMLQDYRPLSDWRASRAYRMLAAQNLLQRFYLETTSDQPARLAGAAEVLNEPG
jgi:xanthine dehydrogenase small subunit